MYSLGSASSSNSSDDLGYVEDIDSLRSHFVFLKQFHFKCCYSITFFHLNLLPWSIND